ncbi:glucan biosynthesis protein D [Niveibacterium sp. SC-1]|uniref:glucan biosynthesis protein n=1 Tax=Niveibacterium sp. SC-1 TaxID=3135646 RepID=UPI00311EB161
MNRRDWIKACSAVALLAASPWAAAAERIKRIGKTQAFDYAWLKGEARSLAANPFDVPSEKLPQGLEKLDWDQYQAIRYRDAHALWDAPDSYFRAKFFHLGLFFKTPVHLYEVVEGQAQEIAYDPAMFDYGKSGVAGGKLPGDLGFAGFRLNYDGDWTRDVVAFLGASYFRAVGGSLQYGMSARGLAIDCGMDRAEEFPRFAKFWLVRPSPKAPVSEVYALLDSASITGAYRFALAPGKIFRMDVDAALYPRKAIERLGIAPLTSMFQFGENDRRVSNDWRPEIHDSDGLILHTGAGEWIWRPLVNPATRRFNAFQDENPRGFGLFQRDTDFDHYQDDGAFYDRRPSVWIEPKAGWGKGSVQLVELSTPDETFDNIVAFWNPAEPPQAGQELLYGYRMSWGSGLPQGPDLARVVATRTGLGGIVGKPRPYPSWRFTVDFAGGDLSMLAADAKVEAAIQVSRGKTEIVSARPLASVGGYRAQFDIKDVQGTEPVDLRLFLKIGSRALSETWLYQWNPPA